LTLSENRLLRELNEDVGEDLFPQPVTPIQALLMVAASGAAFGAGYVPFSWLVPGRGVVRGAAYGATIAVTGDPLDPRGLTKRQMAVLVVSGIVVGWIADS
jgi:hypothetical protein